MACMIGGSLHVSFVCGSLHVPHADFVTLLHLCLKSSPCMLTTWIQQHDGGVTDIKFVTHAVKPCLHNRPETVQTPGSSWTAVVVLRVLHTAGIRHIGSILAPSHGYGELFWSTVYPAV